MQHVPHCDLEANLGATLDKIAALKPNWNSYGALVPTPTALAAARRLVETLAWLQVVPTNTGGIVFVSGASDFEIAINADGDVQVDLGEGE